jgi:hypothetical protein
LHLGASDDSILRIDNPDFDLGRGDDRKDGQKDERQKKYTGEYTRKPHARLLYHAKGLCGRFTPVSWLCESGCELLLEWALTQ